MLLLVNRVNSYVYLMIHIGSPDEAGRSFIEIFAVKR